MAQQAGLVRERLTARKIHYSFYLRLIAQRDLIFLFCVPEIDEGTGVPTPWLAATHLRRVPALVYFPVVSCSLYALAPENLDG